MEASDGEGEEEVLPPSKVSCSRLFCSVELLGKRSVLML